MNRLWVTLIFLSFFPAVVWAGPSSARNAPAAATTGTATADASPRGAISISADQMESVDSEKVVVFTGNVVTRQEELVVNCDRMRVYYQESGVWPEGSSSAEAEPNRETRIDRLVAEGNVKITKEIGRAHV